MTFEMGSDVSTVVVVNCDMELFGWDTAVPADYAEYLVTRDDRLQAFANLLQNLALPVAYMWDRTTQDQDAIKEWITGRGLPPGKVFLRDPVEDTKLIGLDWQRTAIETIVEHHGELPHTIVISDGLDLELQAECEDRSWLYIAV